MVSHFRETRVEQEAAFINGFINPQSLKDPLVPRHIVAGSELMGYYGSVLP